jgi:hypothetical protein
MHLLRYHATDIGSELPNYISKTELVWLIFDVANLKLGIGNKSYSDVAINRSEGFKLFGIICGRICGRSTLFPAFFNRWRHFP